jgi:hypothetical protein
MVVELKVEGVWVSLALALVWLVIVVFGVIRSGKRGL